MPDLKDIEEGGGVIGVEVPMPHAAVLKAIELHLKANGLNLNDMEFEIPDQPGPAKLTKRRGQKLVFT